MHMLMRFVSLKYLPVTLYHPDYGRKFDPLKNIFIRRSFTPPIIHLVCPPKFCIDIVFYFSSLGTTVIPRINKKQRLYKVFGRKQGVLCEMCKWRIVSCNFFFFFQKNRLQNKFFMECAERGWGRFPSLFYNYDYYYK